MIKPYNAHEAQGNAVLQVDIFCCCVLTCLTLFDIQWFFAYRLRIIWLVSYQTGIEEDQIRSGGRYVFLSQSSEYQENADYHEQVSLLASSSIPVKASILCLFSLCKPLLRQCEEHLSFISSVFIDMIYNMIHRLPLVNLNPGVLKISLGLRTLPKMHPSLSINISDLLYLIAFESVLQPSFLVPRAVA